MLAASRMTDTYGWILKAIEKEAMDRAHRQVRELHMFQPRIFGLNPKQIMALMKFYTEHTGKDPMELPEE